MRSRLGALFVVALATAFIAAPVFADEPRVNFAAAIGPSFSNVGTTWTAIGSVRFDATDRVAIIGEVGVVPRAPYEEAAEIASVLPVSLAGDRRVDAYHANANLVVRPWQMTRLTPYLTAGLGAFVTDAVSVRRLEAARLEERRRETDWATNLGGGATYWLTDWLGVSGDYRTFFLYRDQNTPKVHRLTAGIHLRLQ
jgi:hypothetical protein